MTILNVATTLLGIVAGTNHFIHTGFYVRIVPPWLPAPALLVQISGLGEILGGSGVLLRQTRRIAGLGLITLLIAMFPANLEMALHPQLYRDVGSPYAFYVRLPIQFFLMMWVWWTCLRVRELVRSKRHYSSHGAKTTTQFDRMRRAKLAPEEFVRGLKIRETSRSPISSVAAG